MIRSRLALTCCLLLASAQEMNAAGWTQKDGHGFYKLGFQALYARKYHEPSGNVTRITPLGDYTLSLYGEYGFNGWLTGLAYVPFLKLNTLDRVVGRESQTVYFEGDKASGIADVDVGLRVGLIQRSPTVLSVGVLLGLPLGNANQPNGLLSGDGEFNQLVTLEAGHSFYPAPMYANARIGFNNRTRGFSDEFRFGVQVGYTFESLFTVTVHGQGVQSLKNGEVTAAGGMNGLYANNQSYIEYGAELGCALSDMYGISLGVSSATQGRNVLSAVKYSTGVFLKL